MTTQSQLEQDEVGRLISADKVEGTAVYNLAGDKVGSVSNIMIDKISGRVAYAVLATGGILGIGKETIALPWEVLKYNTEKGGYVVDVDHAKLEEAPQMASGDLRQLDNREFEKHIHDYYNIDPYWTFAG
jgi:sporulation protein YlmC with PRC-barrel domain